VQAGAYAEHHIASVTVDNRTIPIDHSHFVATLAPGAGARLRVVMQRYTHQPTLAFPWV
jgi:hypothetical protein